MLIAQPTKKTQCFVYDYNMPGVKACVGALSVKTGTLAWHVCKILMDNCSLNYSLLVRGLDAYIKPCL